MKYIDVNQVLFVESTCFKYEKKHKSNKKDIILNYIILYCVECSPTIRTISKQPHEFPSRDITKINT